MKQNHKSTGHLFFHGEFEYFQFGQDIYRAQITSVFDLHSNRRFGRFECPAHMLNQLKAILGIK